MVAFDTWDQNPQELSLEERAKYEFNRDYATIISDVTSFPHAFLRELLESHWKTAMVSGAMGPRKLSEEEAFAALDAHNRMREDMLSQTETESKRIYGNLAQQKDEMLLILRNLELAGC